MLLMTESQVTCAAKYLPHTQENSSKKEAGTQNSTPFFGMLANHSWSKWSFQKSFYGEEGVLGILGG